MSDQAGAVAGGWLLTNCRCRFRVQQAEQFLVFPDESSQRTARQTRWWGQISELLHYFNFYWYQIMCSVFLYQHRINALIVFPITCKKSQLERVETGFIGSLYMWRVDNSLYRKSQGVVMHILCSCVYFWMNTWTQYVHDYTLIMMWQLSFTRCIVVISVLTIRADFVQFEEKRCYKLYRTAEKRTDASRCQSIPSHKT
jgi:hypothetical protein